MLCWCHALIIICAMPILIFIYLFLSFFSFHWFSDWLFGHFLIYLSLFRHDNIIFHFRCHFSSLDVLVIISMISSILIFNVQCRHLYRFSCHITEIRWCFIDAAISCLRRYFHWCWYFFLRIFRRPPFATLTFRHYAIVATPMLDASRLISFCRLRRRLIRHATLMLIAYLLIGIRHCRCLSFLRLISFSSMSLLRRHFRISRWCFYCFISPDCFAFIDAFILFRISTDFRFSIFLRWCLCRLITLRRLIGFDAAADILPPPLFRVASHDTLSLRRYRLRAIFSADDAEYAIIDAAFHCRIFICRCMPTVWEAIYISWMLTLRQLSKKESLLAAISSPRCRLMPSAACLLILASGFHYHHFGHYHVIIAGDFPHFRYAIYAVDAAIARYGYADAALLLMPLMALAGVRHHLSLFRAPPPSRYYAADFHHVLTIHFRHWYAWADGCYYGALISICIAE